VRTRLDTDRRLIALTFDACGGPSSDGYDAELIDFLIAAEVPTTLFLSLRWIRANPGISTDLAAEPLFEIGNHGTEHRPLSVTGRSAYGIVGTASADEVVEEVMGCQREIADLTGRPPIHFRSGTAHYDEVAARIVDELGLVVAGFDVLGDAGATWSATQVRDALLAARPGSIALLHMNHPGSGTAGGVRQAVPALRDGGFRFVRLGDQRLA
jgi:peptidoglycan/xylan/chitin deacetylase (PgdA/CDA1 family)